MIRIRTAISTIVVLLLALTHTVGAETEDAFTSPNAYSSSNIRQLQVTAQVGEILAIVFGVWVCLLLTCITVYFVALIKRHNRAEDKREAELAALKRTIAEHEERSKNAPPPPQIVVVPTSSTSSSGAPHVIAPVAKKTKRAAKRRLIERGGLLESPSDSSPRDKPAVVVVENLHHQTTTTTKKMRNDEHSASTSSGDGELER